MKLHVLITPLLITPLFAHGCAQALAKTPPNRAAVVMKVGDTEAHVCMGRGEVRPGDRVALFENICQLPKQPGKGIGPWCTKRKTGEGTVTRAINEHYSVIEVDPGSTFREGTIVETQR